MVESAPTGTEMPWRKRNLNFMSVHFKQREISFPWSVLSVFSVWLVQCREQLINLVCDGAVCSLVSALLLSQRKVEQTLRTVSFQGHCLPYLFFTVLKVHWWVPFNLPTPEVPLSAFTTWNSSLVSQESGLEIYFLFSLKNTLGCCFHKQIPITDVPWAIITGSWCVPKRTKGRVVLLTVKKMFQEAPAILKDCNLKEMIEKERELLHSSWKEILPRAGMDWQVKCTTANPHILAFHKELERAAEHLRWTMTVCEERCSSLDMLLWKKNIKPIKMTNIASIFPSPSAERPVITHLWVSTLLALCSYPWLPVGKRDIFFISDSYYIL